jgi:hypothetical protein
MRHLKRLSAWSDDHPVISILVGMLALWLFAMAFLPPDPPYVNQQSHIKGAA